MTDQIVQRYENICTLVGSRTVVDGLLELFKKNDFQNIFVVQFPALVRFCND